MGNKGGWFLAGKGNLVGQPSAFVWPFSDALKITKNMALTLKSALVDWRTTAEWEDFIFKAQEEWDSVEAQTLENIQEGSLGDEDVDDNSDDLIEGDLALSTPPKIFKWTNKLEGLDGTLKTKLDEMNPKNTKEAVEELQVAFGDLEGMVVDARRSLGNNAIEVLNHVGSSMVEILVAINQINKRGRRLASEVGNMLVLRDDSGLHDIMLVDAVARVISSMALQDHTIDNVASDIEDLSGLIAAVNADLSMTCTILNNKIRALERLQSSPPVTLQSLPTLTMATAVPDKHRAYVTTLGGILGENTALKLSNERLTCQIEKLSADVTTQGGVVLGKYTFTSELQLMELHMKECPKGDAFATFVNPMIIFCFDPSYIPIAGWETLTKAMEKSRSYPVTDRKGVTLFNAHHLHWFSEGKTVVASKPLQAFVTKEKWQGTGGMDGRHVEIEILLDTAMAGVRTAVEDKLPEGSQLSQLALRMLEHTLSWFTMLFNHLDMEFTLLTQVHISEEEMLILLSEEVIIMFDCFHAI
jgi:hypothetical protein